MKNEIKEPRYCILIADDDPDDQYMIKEALNASALDREVRSVSDGEELMDYLHRREKFKDMELPRPSVILLDLNMPKKDGRECLIEIKADPKLSRIPIVIFSTSNNQDDVIRSYESGAASYIAKPYSYNELVEVMEAFKKYWFSTVTTPDTNL